MRLEPPIHLPSSAPDASQVEIWLRLPEHGEISTRTGEDGVARLDFPPGTIADRVEYAGLGDDRRVVDVRGATVDDAGRCRWHVLRPTSAVTDAALFGVQWPCDDDDAQSSATSMMLDALATRGFSADVPPTARARELASFAAKNDCGGCHRRARPDATVEGEHGIVHRGTDANGFFVPQTVLSDAVPLERYGRFDPNAADPAVTAHCDGGRPAARVDRNGSMRWSCSDGRVPVGRYDWGIARRRDPFRVARLCSSRAALIEHADPETRARFADAIRVCAP